MIEYSALESAFRKMRQVWFQSHLHHYAQEREWESEEDEERRNQDNLKTRALFDAQTESILLGEQCEIGRLCPRCWNDLTGASLSEDDE